MLYSYGYIEGTEGTDDDGLDVYVGPNHDSSLVVVVHQQDPDTKKFDEDKVMLGFDSEKEAVAAYKASYDNPGYYQSHVAMPIGTFWRWVHDEENRGRKVKVAAFGKMVSKLVQKYKLDPKTVTRGLGYSPASQKWYGWSHRAVHGFDTRRQAVRFADSVS